MSDAGSEYDLDSPVGRANWRVKHLLNAHERVGEMYDLSPEELYQATRRYPFERRDCDDPSDPYKRADYRFGLVQDVQGSIERYMRNRHGHSRMYGNPGYPSGILVTGDETDTNAETAGIRMVVDIVGG